MARISKKVVRVPTRESLAADVAEYLARGNRIQLIPPGVSGDDPAAAYRRTPKTERNNT